MRRLTVLAGAFLALVPLLGLVPAGAAGDPPFSLRLRWVPFLLSRRFVRLWNRQVTRTTEEHMSTGKMR